MACEQLLETVRCRSIDINAFWALNQLVVFERFKGFSCDYHWGWDPQAIRVPTRNFRIIQIVVQCSQFLILVILGHFRFDCGLFDDWLFMLQNYGVSWFKIIFLSRVFLFSLDFTTLVFDSHLVNIFVIDGDTYFILLRAKVVVGVRLNDESVLPLVAVLLNLVIYII